jgi:hypothetical protein
MRPQELSDARHSFGMGRKQFARLVLGYSGEDRNSWIVMKRYETGQKPIPEYIARLVLMLTWFKSDFGYLPDLERGERVPLEMPAEFDE